MDYFFYNHDLLDWGALKVGAYETLFTKNQEYDFANIRDAGFAGYNSNTVLIRFHKTTPSNARLLSTPDIAEQINSFHVQSCVHSIKGITAATYKITIAC